MLKAFGITNVPEKIHPFAFASLCPSVALLKSFCKWGHHEVIQ